jgi:hypothetical protein
MQLTARQREFAAIAVWALPVSITLGAIFGHFQAPSGSVWGYIQARRHRHSDFLHDSFARVCRL